MTYGEMKAYVLQLLNQYSVGGREVELSYNGQADDVARIPALVRDGLYYITTTVRRLRATRELTEPKQIGSMVAYDLPPDFYQLAGGILRLDGSGHCCRTHDYEILGGNRILVPSHQNCTYVAEYFRYPAVAAGQPQDSDPIDCPPEAQGALAYYVAAHIAMEDNNFLYGALMNEFERRMAMLQEGVTAQWGIVTDDYGLSEGRCGA